MSFVICHLSFVICHLPETVGCVTAMKGFGTQKQLNLAVTHHPCFINTF
ncbi:hypothetical protein FDUTEX481_08477 [Tolypothrix sp. PCC 7601]|nr:hypothetical protein FDUTEX481_08477 [Tolypothrix sp. PCC 7601]